MPPKTKAQKEREKAKKKRDEEHQGHICKFEVIDLPTPLDPENLDNVNLKYVSPDVSRAKVVPERPSVSKTDGIPDPPDQSELDLKKPKSGVFINVPKDKAATFDMDSIDKMFLREEKRKTKTLPKEPKDNVEDNQAEDDTDDDDYYYDYFDDDDDDDDDIDLEAQAALEQAKIKNEEARQKRHAEREERIKAMKAEQESRKRQPPIMDKETYEKYREMRKQKEAEDEKKREEAKALKEKESGQNEWSGGDAIEDGHGEDDIPPKTKPSQEAKVPPQKKQDGGAGEGAQKECEVQPATEKKPDDEEDVVVTRLRRTVSQESKSTSVDPNDFFTPFEDFEDKEDMEKLIQKYRRDSDQHKVIANEPPVPQRGTLESHSFTEPRQTVHTDFYFGLRAGTVHQGDLHFSARSRNRQGLCNAVAAYCYNVLRHPDRWTRSTVDDVLEVGDRLYLDSVNALHAHNVKRVIEPEDLYRYCYVGKAKVRFKLHEAELTGLMRSTDKSIYNISKGLKLFFQRHCSAVLQTRNLDLLVWHLGHYYIFDATPKNSDLCPDEKRGVAVLITVYSLRDVISVLLERFRVGNWPFKLLQITCQNVLDADAEDRESVLSDYMEPNEFNVLNGHKAVINGSFDLADKCFDFTRNKQAMTMAVISLVYSRITPPNAWRKKTIDKIMVIGNQLLVEIFQEEEVEEMRLDILPAYFTIGPYMVEIFIYANRQTGFLYRKSVCQLNKALDDFFMSANSALMEIEMGPGGGGKCCVALWQQRNIFYLFDPYARNKDGLRCRQGSACLTIDCSLDGILETLLSNFDDREATFRLHAMKVLKIHRDPDRAKLFPKEQPMREVPMEVLKKAPVKTRRKRVATTKPVIIDVSDYAMRRLIEIIDSPGPSINEIGSKVGSLQSNELPRMIAARWSMMSSRDELNAKRKPLDLDSPSLSDTQLDPLRPVPPKNELPVFVDFTSDSFALTQEEVEIEQKPEGEGGEDQGSKMAKAKLKARGDGAEEEDQGGEGGSLGDEAFEAKKQMFEQQSKFSQADDVGVTQTKQVMTEDDTFRPLKRKLLQPMNLMEQYENLKAQLRAQQDGPFPEEEPDVTQSQELAKRSNFVTLPDDSQLVRGTTNIGQYGVEEVEYVAPFIAIMCAPVALKYSISTWSSDIVDYILQCGTELYKAANVRYDQVPKLQIPKISLGRTDYSITVEYLHDGQLKAKPLEKAIDQVLFGSFNCGLVVTACYSVAVFFKHHLYYMFDGFGCNQCGLGEGPANTGVACFARFKDLKSLVGRFLHNKLKREADDNYSNTRFVLSSCVSVELPPESEQKTARRKKMLRRPKPGRLFDDDDEMAEEMDAYEEAEEYTADDQPREEEQKSVVDEDKRKKKKDDEEKERESKNKVGYQKVDGQYVIQGSKALQGRGDLSVALKEDHFVCVCACLMLLNHPVRKWDTKRVNQVLDQGCHIHSHADQLALSNKRTIKNILVGRRIFDIVVHRVTIAEAKRNKGLNSVLDHIMTKRNYSILQFPNCCYVLYKNDGFYHLFDPYSCANVEKKKGQQNGRDRDRQPRKGTPRQEQKDRKENKAGWTLFRTMHEVKRRIKKNMIEGGQSYTLYSFDVISITKAPKRLTVQHQLGQHVMDRELPMELFRKPFHEDEQWLKKNRKMAWTSVYQNAQGDPRGVHTWHNWEVEYPKDLFSLRGTIHQTDERFELEIRGKQTLANLVVGIGMTDIYEMCEWNTSIVDNVLVFGNEYFKDCIKDIDEEKYEISTDDLVRKCSIYPYSFQVVVKPVLAGTMFLMSVKVFNLYKALRYFFKDVENRAGIICTLNGDVKRFLAFGKIQEMEYFMYDCQAEGGNFHVDGDGVGYFLRCTTLNRLLHCLVVTLRSGDFFIYDVVTSNFSPMEDE